MAAVQQHTKKATKPVTGHLPTLLRLTHSDFQMGKWRPSRLTTGYQHHHSITTYTQKMQLVYNSCPRMLR